ncbi:MAG: hypothetical protein ACE5FN_12520 [Leptospirillia bacterium]
MIEHAPDDLVAACQCDDECDTVPLTRSDIVVWRLDRKKLAATVASALGATQEWGEVGGLPMTWRVGTYAPTAGYRFPVYLTIRIESAEFRSSIAELVAKNDDAFIVVAPTSNLFKPACEEMLAKRNACFFSLSDLFVLDEKKGGLIASQLPEALLLAFRTAVLPTVTDGASSMEFFPTPAGATWSNVTIRFTDGHTVFVSVTDAGGGQFNYTQMGMADRRNGNPTVRWTLLQAFAERYGVLDWNSPHAHPRNQKRKEQLARDLQAFFRIKGDPFRLTDDGKGWQSVFSISPEE